MNIELSSHGHAVHYTCLYCLSNRRIPAPPILHDFSPDSPQANLQAPKAKEVGDEQIIGQPIEIVVNGKPNAVVAETNFKSTTKRARRAKKKNIKPRPVPFFDRKGHVIFVGNEVAGPATDAN